MLAGRRSGDRWRRQPAPTPPRKVPEGEVKENALRLSTARTGRCSADARTARHLRRPRSTSGTRTGQPRRATDTCAACSASSISSCWRQRMAARSSAASQRTCSTFEQERSEIYIYDLAVARSAPAPRHRHRATPPVAGDRAVPSRLGHPRPGRSGRRAGGQAVRLARSARGRVSLRQSGSVTGDDASSRTRPAQADSWGWVSHGYSMVRLPNGGERRS